MYCYKCGTQLVEEANFCHKCGTEFKITNTSSEVIPNVISPEELFSETYVPEIFAPEIITPVNSKKNFKSETLLFLLDSTITWLLIFIAIVSYFLGHNLIITILSIIVAIMAFPYNPIYRLVDKLLKKKWLHSVLILISFVLLSFYSYKTISENTRVYRDIAELKHSHFSFIDKENNLDRLALIEEYPSHKELLNNVSSDRIAVIYDCYKGHDIYCSWTEIEDKLFCYDNGYSDQVFNIMKNFRTLDRESKYFSLGTFIRLNDIVGIRISTDEGETDSFFMLSIENNEIKMCGFALSSIKNIEESFMFSASGTLLRAMVDMDMLDASAISKAVDIMGQNAFVEYGDYVWAKQFDDSGFYFVGINKSYDYTSEEFTSIF